MERERVMESEEITPEPETFEAERERRRRRWLVWGGSTAVVLLVGGAFAVRPLVHAGKAWRARRVAAESLAFIEQGRLQEGADKARDAYLIFPAEPETWRPLGRLLTSMGRGTTALQWWQKLEQAGKLTLEDRRAYIVAALAADAPALARTQLDWLLARPGGKAPVDLLLDAREAAWHQDFTRVERDTALVLDDPRASALEQYSAAAQILGLSAPPDDLFRQAYGRVMQIARGPANPASLDSLVFLAWRATNPSADGLGDAFPHIAPAELAAALEAHPQAGAYHHLLALELRALADPAQDEKLAAEAMARFGESAEENIVAALLRWLYRSGRYEAILHLLPAARAANASDLAMPYLDSLGALGRWEEAKDFLVNKYLPLNPMAARMYLAVVRAHLGETVGANIEWERASSAAGKNAEKLMMLGQFAAKNGEFATADAAFAAAIAAAPKLRAAYFARYQQALAHGEASRAEELLAETARQWPEDQTVRDEQTYLRLLLAPVPAEVEAAEKAAAARLGAEPANMQLKINLALARLRLGRTEAASAVFGERGIEGGNSPEKTASPVVRRARMVRAATLLARGRQNEANSEMDKMPTASLLPEEKALLAVPAIRLPPR